MNPSEEETKKSVWRRSSCRLAIWAAIPFVGFLICAMLGGKGYIQVLTGIQPFSEYEMIIGSLYLLSYTVTMLFSPVFLLAAAMIAVWDRFSMRTRKATSSAR